MIDPTSVPPTVAWFGIAVCLSQSAMFSGLNLAVFGMSRLRIEVEASNGNRHAAKLLALRRDSNFLLTTILWGNVGVNVLLTLLSDSVLTGVAAFAFSTIVITFAGEILPQAYFSRHALKMASLLCPLLQFYQFLFFPFAKPSALLLDAWLGHEGIQYFRERDLSEIIRKHIEADETDLSHIEGMGAINFFAIDDLKVSEEGEPVAPDSVVAMPVEGNLPVFPKFERSSSDPFLKRVQASQKKWVILTDSTNNPLLVLDADAFLRAAFFDADMNPYSFTHRPILVENEKKLLGHVFRRLRVHPQSKGDDVIDHDIILVWAANQKRIITGADILGRLLRGISTHSEPGKEVDAGPNRETPAVTVGNHD